MTVPSPPWTRRLGRRTRIIGAVAGDILAALVIVALAFAPFTIHGPQSALDMTVALVPAALLPFRRLWPVPVLAACIALFGVAAFGGDPSPGIVLASAIAMFGVANRTDRRVSLVVAVSTIAAIVALSLFASIGGSADQRVVQFAVTIAFFAAAGDATRSRRAYIAAFIEHAEYMEQTREAEARRRVSEERLRIARDLHDVVAHQISVISLNAGVASSVLRSRPDAAEEALATIRSASRTVLGEIGDLLAMLRADGDERAAAHTGPQPGLGAFDDLVAEFGASGLDVRSRVEGSLDGIPAAVDVVAYRIVQEALTNALKHGTEGRAHVLVSVMADRLEIVVTNPTTPASPSGIAGLSASGGLSATAAHDESRPPSAPSGFGLLGLRERVAAVRGMLDAGPAAGGFRLAAVLPTTADSPATPLAHATVPTPATDPTRSPEATA